MDRTHSMGLLPLGALLVVGTSLGVTNNIAKLGLAYGVPLPVLLFWSVLGAAVLLAMLALATRRAPALGPRTLEYGAISGLLLVAVPTLTGYAATKHVGAGFVSLSAAFVPLITYLFASLLRIERLRWVRGAGVLAGLAGALLLALGKARSPDAEPLWIAATLTIPVTIAVGNIYRTLRWPPGAASLSLAPLMLAGAAPWLLPFALFSGVASAIASGPGLLLIAAQSVVFTLTYSLYFVLQRIAGPVYLSQIGSVGAVSGTVIAVFGFGETLPSGFAMAAVLIVVGVALFNWRR